MLMRYPVKSMRGEPLDAAELTFQGLPGDRRYAFVQAEGGRPLFPWLTARELAAMLRYQPRHESVDGRARVLVETPDGLTLPVRDDALRAELEERTGRKAFLIANYAGNYDVAPVSLISFGTLRQVAEESGVEIEPERFRMNLYVDSEAPGGFNEQEWVGRVLRIGVTARLAVQQPDERCMMITLHPQTGDASPAVHAAVAKNHNNTAGVYGVVLTPGPIRPGDPVYLE